MIEIWAPWTAKAACRDEPPELFFASPKSEQELVEEAKGICADCEVKDECLAEALTLGDRHGIRGGLTADERAELPRSGRPQTCSQGHILTEGTVFGENGQLRTCGICKQLSQRTEKKRRSERVA